MRAMACEARWFSASERRSRSLRSTFWSAALASMPAPVLARAAASSEGSCSAREAAEMAAL